jgi:hypothetical protein
MSLTIGDVVNSETKLNEAQELGSSGLLDAEQIEIPQETELVGERSGGGVCKNDKVPA